MIRVTAPGLPPHPKLLFDEATRRAKIVVRHATWQSQERALYVTEAIVWLVVALSAWQSWQWLPGWELPSRCLLLLAIVAALLPITRYALRNTLPTFIARQLLATRLEFWLSPEAMAFRCHRYDQPVVVWREWEAKPVRLKFILQNDRDAEAYHRSLGNKRSLPVNHLHEARLLELVLTTVNRHTAEKFDGQGTILRTIPVSEIDSQLATKVTMVLAAAVTLTVPQQREPVAAAGGQDIDF